MVEIQRTPLYDLHSILTLVLAAMWIIGMGVATDLSETTFHIAQSWSVGCIDHPEHPCFRYRRPSSMVLV